MATFLSKLVAGSMLVTSSALSAALAQSTQPSHPVFVAAEYTYVRANIAPGCSCFWLNGGSVQALISLSGHIDAIADVTLGRQGRITPDGYALTQLSYTFGARYLPTHRAARSQPFVEAKLGGASAFGTLSPQTTGYGGSNAFALEAGGGLQVRLRPHLFVIPLEASYLLTKFSNGADGRQNDLRLSAGLLFRLGR